MGKNPIAAGMLMGFEAEMCMPNVESEDDGDMERDYEMDERAYSIDDIYNDLVLEFTTVTQVLRKCRIP